jgi:hypothetical protein
MFHLLKRIASDAASASRVSNLALLISSAGAANGLYRFAF